MKRKIWLLTLLVFFLPNGAWSKAKPCCRDLKKCVQQYWKSIIKGDLVQAFQYEHIAYLKKLDVTTYIKNYGKNMKYEDFKLIKIGKEASGPKGSTPVFLKTKVRILGLNISIQELEIKRRDLWVKEKDGCWYHLITNLNSFY